MVPFVGAPLAYFITFHTYGTRLPGSPRGSVDAYRTQPGTPQIGPAPTRERASAQQLVRPPILLVPTERSVVLRTVQEVCGHRGWRLHAAHVRVNHVHVVVCAVHSAERVMNDLKAWSTRRVVEAGLQPVGTRLWVRHGSTRYLWTPRAVEAVCGYVVHGQGAGKDWAVWEGSPQGAHPRAAAGRPPPAGRRRGSATDLPRLAPTPVAGTATQRTCPGPPPTHLPQRKRPSPKHPEPRAPASGPRPRA